MHESLTLADVCEEIADCVNRTAPETVDGSFFAVGTPAMRGNVIDLSQARQISEETFKRWIRRLLPLEGDLLLAREAPVGPVVRIPAGGKVAAGQRTMHLRADPMIVHPRYLFYLLISPEVQSRLMALAMGSTVAHLRVAEVKAFTLPGLPSMKVQTGVQEVLGALDDKIAVNGRIANTYEELLGARFAEMKIDADPDSGSVVLVSEIVEFNPSLKVTRVADAVYLDMAAVPTDRATVSEWSRREPKSGTRFANGDTVMARITPCLENGKTAFIDFMKLGEVGIGSTEFIVMRARPGVPVHLPYFLARSSRFRNHAIQNMVGSSGRQRVAAAQLINFPLARPSGEHMLAFGTAAAAAFGHMRSLADESKKLAELRDTLLPRLMSGAIRVRDATKVVEDVT